MPKMPKKPPRKPRKDRRPKWGLKRPDYAIYGDQGTIEELFCKVCGTAIAGRQQHLRDVRQDESGVTIRTVETQFRRFPNYTEIKMEFDDGSFHVTNGCNKCLNKRLTKEQMTLIHEADVRTMPTAFMKRDLKRKPIRITVVDNRGRGIR